MTHPIGKIAFVSPHCLLDFTNGAATATLDGLALLARSGFECLAFCGTRMDAREEVRVDEMLARRGVPYTIRDAQIGRHRGRMIFTRHGPLPVTLFNAASTRGGWINGDEAAAFLSGCEIFLRRNRPDLVWSYGGDPVSKALYALARQLGIPVLFALHNFNYGDPATFAAVDYTIVPTEFARRFYWDRLGLRSHVLPLVMDPGRAMVTKSEISNLKSEISNKEEIQEGKVENGARAERNEYVTFVNPEPRKGVHVFARIAEVLSCRRPDIRLLIVEGAGKVIFLPGLGIDVRGMKNVDVMANTPDPRQFYAKTKLLLMPSLRENAAFVAMEAMSNGIPILASNRGGLPETIGNNPHPNPLPTMPTNAARRCPMVPGEGNGESQISNLKLQIGPIGPHPNPLPEGEGTSGGFLFDIPARYTPETRELPTAEEVEPWVETIVRLWDDAAGYERWSRAARERARRWHPERLAPVYGEFFGRLTHRPGA